MFLQLKRSSWHWRPFCRMIPSTQQDSGVPLILHLHWWALIFLNKNYVQEFFLYLPNCFFSSIDLPHVLRPSSFQQHQIGKRSIRGMKFIVVLMVLPAGMQDLRKAGVQDPWRKAKLMCMKRSGVGEPIGYPKISEFGPISSHWGQDIRAHITSLNFLHIT